MSPTNSTNSLTTPPRHVERKLYLIFWSEGSPQKRRDPLVAFVQIVFLTEGTLLPRPMEKPPAAPESPLSQSIVSFLPFCSSKGVGAPQIYSLRTARMCAPFFPTRSLPLYFWASMSLATEESRTVMQWASSSSVMTRGGERRMVWLWVPLARRPPSLRIFWKA